MPPASELYLSVLPEDATMGTAPMSTAGKYASREGVGMAWQVGLQKPNCYRIFSFTVTEGRDDITFISSF